MTLFGNRAFAEGIKGRLEMRSPWVSLGPGCTEGGRREHTEEAATSQGCRHHHEPGEAGRTPRWSPRRELGPGTPGSQTLASRTARGYMSLVLSHRFCGNLLWQPQDMITNGTGRKGHGDSGRVRAESLLVLRLQTSEHGCWFNAPSEATHRWELFSRRDPFAH